MSRLEFQKVVNVLGGTKVVGKASIDRLQDLLLLSRDGLPFESFLSVSQSAQLGEEETRGAIGMPKRTLERRKVAKRLDASEAERLVSLARVIAQAREVFSDEDKARTWLLSRSRALGARPIELVGSAIGNEVVLSELARIEHGVFG
jgi:putative toxin-antitoxin system antitoxin component (TIGR02293 family)